MSLQPILWTPHC